MKKNLILSLVAASFLAAGCAMESNTASSEPAAEKEYPTGSNIPRRSGGPTSGVTTLNKDAVDRMPTVAPTSPASGGK